jgi:hypothetical protein
MSAAESEWRFGVAVEPADVRAPTRDDYTPADERVEAFAYDCGVVELRTAKDGEFLNTTHPVNVQDFR